MTTYADSASALGTSRTEPDEASDTPSCAIPQPYYVLPADLEPGDQLRDHGRLRTISHVSTEPPILRGLLTVYFEWEPADGDDETPHLGIPSHQGVWAYRTT